MSQTLWKLLAAKIAGYVKGSISDLTPFWEIFMAVVNIDLKAETQPAAEEYAAQLFDNIISVEVTNCEVLRIMEMQNDVVLTANKDVQYIDVQYVKVLCLVHMKVVTE